MRKKKEIKYYFNEVGGDILFIFDEYSRVRLNEEEIIQLEKAIREIKQLYKKDIVKHAILNQETVLDVKNKTPLGKI